MGSSRARLTSCVWQRAGMACVLPLYTGVSGCVWGCSSGTDSQIPPPAWRQECEGQEGLLPLRWELKYPPCPQRPSAFSPSLFGPWSEQEKPQAFPEVTCWLDFVPKPSAREESVLAFGPGQDSPQTDLRRE